MNEPRLARLIANGVAVVAPAVTLLVRWPLDVVLGDRVLYMAFFPAVLLASYLGGFWPGLLATILSALVLGDVMTPLQGLGSAIMLGALVAFQLLR